MLWNSFSLVDQKGLYQRGLKLKATWWGLSAGAVEIWGLHDTIHVNSWPDNSDAKKPNETSNTRMCCEVHALLKISHIWFRDYEQLKIHIFFLRSRYQVDLNNHFLYKVYFY